MSHPTQFREHGIQTVELSSVKMYIKEGVGGTTMKAALDAVQGLLDSKFPGAGLTLTRNGENIIERECIPNTFQQEGNQFLSTHVCADVKANIVTVTDIGKEHHPTQNEHQSQDLHDVEMANNVPMDFHQPVPQPNTTDHDLEIVLLRSKAEALAAEKKVLEQSLEHTVEENAELSSRLNEAVQERDELRRQRQANMLKIRKLGDMIVKNSQTSDEPLDEDILQDTYKVRNMTTEVIKKAYPDNVLIMPEVAKDLTKRFNTDYYSRFYIQRVMIDKAPERRRRLLISMLFEVLHDKFFALNARRFGVPRDMEKTLQEFEWRIEENSKVDFEECLDWRKRTVSYAGHLQLNCHETIEKCRDRLFAILTPVLIPGYEDRTSHYRRQVADLQHSLYDLCSASLNLALRFRSTKTKYEFKFYEPNTRLASCDEELIKKLDSEGTISKPIDSNRLQIFCTLFGALVKTRPPVSGEPCDPVVLEKAQVIVFEPDQWGHPR